MDGPPQDHTHETVNGNVPEQYRGLPLREVVPLVPYRRGKKDDLPDA